MSQQGNKALTLLFNGEIIASWRHLRQFNIKAEKGDLVSVYSNTISPSKDYVYCITDKAEFFIHKRYIRRLM